MTFDAIASHPVSIGAIPWPSGRITVVVKLTFLLGPDDVFALAPEGEIEPLLLDAFDDGGALLYPSDFAPYKPACDVVVIGADARDRSREGVVAVGSLLRRVEPGSGLGPRESFGPLGDPLAPEAIEQWSSGALDVTRFHAAPPPSRLPFPTAPFPVEYARGAVTMRGVFRGPLPKVVVTGEGGALLAGPIPMLLDTVALAPSRGRLVIVTRGLHDPQPGTSDLPRFVVDLSEHPAAPPSDGWRSIPVADPRRLRVAQELDVGETTTATSSLDDVSTVDRRETAPLGHPIVEETAFGAAPGGAALPFGRGLDREATRTLAASRPTANPLPFAGAAAPAPRASSILDLQTLRAEGRELVRPAWEAVDGTAVQSGSAAGAPVAAAPAPARAAPTAAVPPVAMAPLAMAPVAMAPVVPVASPPVASPPAPPPPVAPRVVAPPVVAPPAPPPVAPPPAAPAVTDDQVERVAAIQRELWKGERSLKDVLAENGLDEAAWRALKRAATAR